MNTELTIQTENGKSIAEMLGVSVGSGGTKKSTLARMTQIHSPIMGDIPANGKTIRGEVIQAGSYKLVLDDGNVVYDTNPHIRVFAIFQQWTRWDSENNTMQKTELNTELKGDLKDSQGGFNLGRPTGYVKDWDALPQQTKELMRQVKRTKVVFATVSLNNPVDSDGKSIDSTYEDIAMIMDIKNRDSIKALDAMVKRIQGLNAMPLNYQLKLSAEEHTLPTGNTYSSMVFSLQDKQDIVPSDNDLADGFIKWVKWSNGYIYDQWAEHNNKKVDKDMADFINENMSDAKEPGWLDVKGEAV
tara:strand:- start:712 stop:1614 length:903 start_codon:yes stop_codon:yes gene_type:complete